MEHNKEHHQLPVMQWQFIQPQEPHVVLLVQVLAAIGTVEAVAALGYVIFVMDQLAIGVAHVDTCVLQPAVGIA